MEQLLLRDTEALRLLNIGRSKLWELMLSGEIPSIKIGKSRRIPASALRQWVDEQVKQASGVA